MLIVLKGQHWDTEIARFMEVGRSFVVKVRKELEAAYGDLISAAESKTHAQDPDTIRTHKILRKLQ